MLSLIVATDSKDGIGKDNTIPWTSRADMKHFKETTMGSTVIMGFNTFKSLDYKPLPGRNNVVVLDFSREIPDTVLESGCTILPNTSVQKFIKDMSPNNHLFLIGGAAQYEEYMKYCDRLIHTTIMGDYECDKNIKLFGSSVGWEFLYQEVLQDGSVVRYYNRVD